MKENLNFKSNYLFCYDTKNVTTNDRLKQLQVVKKKKKTTNNNNNNNMYRKRKPSEEHTGSNLILTISRINIITHVDARFLPLTEHYKNSHYYNVYIRKLHVTIVFLGFFFFCGH